MAAGLGFIEFTTGDVLSAAAANGYLASQTVMVFATAAARTSAIASPQEGMISFLKDSDTMQFYTGAAWSNVDTGASPLTTKGDVYGYSTTNARLAVGANNTVLTADSAEATGLKWATPSSGKFIQRVFAQFDAVATGTTVLPQDDTIPQITEGTQFMTLAITPTSVTSILYVTSNFYGSASVSDSLAMALFLDAGANAIGVTAQEISPNLAITMHNDYSMAAGSTSAMTFRVRVGSGGPGTVTMNGDASARLYGAIPKSSITITEYTP